MIPTFIFTIWLSGLFSVAIVGAAICLGHEWYARSWEWSEELQRSLFAPRLGWNEPTWFLTGAILLALMATAGGPILKTILRVILKSGNDPQNSHSPPVSKHRLKRTDGSSLAVKIYGAENAPPLILTHGWGLNSREWNYLTQELARHFRVIVWDEPGLGSSRRPSNNDFSTEKFAHDLRAVLRLAEGRPAFLIGHSIGGMITLTFCRLFPEALGSLVAGLVLTHTTYTDPVRTTKGAAFLKVIEKPILVPLMYLTIALSPFVRLMNWLSYLNGTAHLSTMRSSFAGTESWEQVDFAARFQLQAPPAVLARGMLGMMRYDATAILSKINVATLVVAGDRDSTCLPSASERMAMEIPGARLVTFKPARHLGFIEHHEKFAQLLHEFVRTSSRSHHHQKDPAPDRVSV